MKINLSEVDDAVIKKAKVLKGQGKSFRKIGKSKLDDRLPEIVDLLGDKATYSFMARRFKVSRPTVINFVKTRNLLKAGN